MAPGTPGVATFTGRYQRDGYAYEKYFIQGEGDYVVPFVLMLPPGDGPFPAVIALYPDGRLDAIRKGGTMEALVRKGYAVLSPDLIGTGETGPGTYRGDSYGYRQGKGDYNIWFGALQVGRSIVGIRAGDVARLVQYLRGNPKIDAGSIAAVAHGRMGPVLLHAAAFEPGIARVALLDSLATYDSIVMNEYYKPELIHATVPGALTAYDLPDLAATLAPRPLLVRRRRRPLRTAGRFGGRPPGLRRGAEGLCRRGCGPRAPDRGRRRQKRARYAAGVAEGQLIAPPPRQSGKSYSVAGLSARIVFCIAGSSGNASSRMSRQCAGAGLPSAGNCGCGQIGR